MDIDSGLLLGAVSALATVVVYLWRRIEADAKQERLDHEATKLELKEVTRQLIECLMQTATLMIELTKLKKRVNENGK